MVSISGRLCDLNTPVIRHHQRGDIAAELQPSLDRTLDRVSEIVVRRNGVGPFPFVPLRPERLPQISRALEIFESRRRTVNDAVEPSSHGANTRLVRESVPRSRDLIGVALGVKLRMPHPIVGARLWFSIQFALISDDAIARDCGLHGSGIRRPGPPVQVPASVSSRIATGSDSRAQAFGSGPPVQP